MAAQSEQRVRHRRKVTERRAVIAGALALGVTGAAIVTTTSLLSSAGAAASWPTANGSKAVTSTIEVSGTYDGRLTKFHGSGALGGSGQEEDQDPIFRLADGAVLKNVIIGRAAVSPSDLRPLPGQQQRQGAEGTRHRTGWNLLQVLVI
ncbi:pectate lyase [Streptomyces sp. NPDC007808]|uniref:pectate lyase n=1 Tax=Streptomyces sp. NPDC007808 TaxID=3364779 RepID=UPI0036C5BBA5